jgi:hypothetical protein
MFYIAEGKSKDSDTNDAKHFHTLIDFQCPLESNFDLLLSFPNIWTVPHFQRICNYFYVTIFPCILVMRQQHTLKFSLRLLLDQPPY